MKELVKQSFAYCPHCKCKMLYMLHNFQIAVPDESGRYVTNIIDEENNIVAYCPKCNSKFELIRTIDGIVTKEYNTKQTEILKENILGYVKENKNDY